MKIRKRTERLLTFLAENYKIPYELLCGIYILESTYRKWYHRLAENVLTCLFLFVNYITGIPIRNFTIGRCQVGLANVLCFCGHKRYRHCADLNKVTFDEMKMIIKAMTPKGSIECCAWLLSDYYQTEMAQTNDIQSAIIGVGERYNGTLTYGILLERLYFELKNCQDGSFIEAIALQH